jgi:hypothetical protein
MVLRAIKMDKKTGTNFTLQSKGSYTYRIIVDPATGARELHTDLPKEFATDEELIKMYGA